MDIFDEFDSQDTCLTPGSPVHSDCDLVSRCWNCGEYTRTELGMGDTVPEIVTCRVCRKKGEIGQTKGRYNFADMVGQYTLEELLSLEGGT